MKKTIAIFLLLTLLVCALSSCRLLTHIGSTYPDAEKYTPGDTVLSAEGVENLALFWTAGRVEFLFSDASEITLAETPAQETDEAKLHWYLDGDTLRVQFAASGYRTTDFINRGKTLTVTLPRGFSADTLSVSVASADVLLSASDVLTLKTLDLSSASGDLSATVSAVETARLESTSGSVKFDSSAPTMESASIHSTSGTVRASILAAGSITVTSTSGDVSVSVSGSADLVMAKSTSGKLAVNGNGRIGTLSLHSTSGDVHAHADAASVSVNSTSGGVRMEFATLPDVCRADTTSGNILLFLPADCDATFDVDQTSGHFDYDIPLSSDGERYLAGNGQAQFTLAATSGNITICGIKP